MKSSYVLVPKLLTPVINAGKQIEVEIYLTGSGPLSANKLVITISSKYLVNPESPGTITGCIGTQILETGESHVVAGKSYLDAGYGKTSLDATGTTIGVINAYFRDIPDESGQPAPWALNQIYGEKSYDGLAPFILKINTKEKIPKGDYTIDMAFTYSYGEEMASDYKVVTVHVTDFVEKHTRILTVGSIIGTIIAVVGFVQPLITDFLSGG